MPATSQPAGAQPVEVELLQALGRDDVGTVQVGKRADLCVLDTTTAYDLVYEWGRNHVAAVVAPDEVEQQIDPGRVAGGGDGHGGRAKLPRAMKVPPAEVYAEYENPRGHLGFYIESTRKIVKYQQFRFASEHASCRRTLHLSTR